MTPSPPSASPSDGAAYFGAFLVALVAALVATPVARRIAVRFDVLDHPSERKAHLDPVPYLGGMAIIAAFAVAMMAGATVRGVQGVYGKVAAILGGALIVAGMGLWDDIRPVPGWTKAAVELPLAVGLYAAGVRADPFDPWSLNFLLTVGWVVGVVNAVNFLDNMDGLTAGVSAIAAAYFAVLAGLSGQTLVASLAAAVAGCALGFLWFNRPPAQIHMGDAGSLLLGFLLASIGLELQFRNLERVAFFVPVAVLAVPLFDTLMVSVSRVRRGLSPLHPGLDHASHRLVRVGIPHHAAVGLLYLASASCGWLGVVIAYARPLTAYFLMGWIVTIGLLLGALMLRIRIVD